jgi:hypothetical protein
MEDIRSSKDTKAIINEISDEFGSTFSFLEETDTGYRLANWFSRPNDKKEAEAAIKKVLGNETQIDFQTTPSGDPLYEVVITFKK